MTILVVGGGSMGRRRLRDLTYLVPRGVVLLEAMPDRARKVGEAFNVTACTELEQAMALGPDAVVVSTPPALHQEYVSRAVQNRLPVFAEVPFVLDLDCLRDITARAATGQTGVLGISHTIRYYPPFRLIQDLMRRSAIGRALYLEYSLGNYLPDWHPYEDYLKFYASDQALGGAGMDMLLHELSAMQWWMGPVAGVQARLAKVSALEIKGPDCHDALLRFASGAVGFFHHDVIERGTVGRHVRIVGEGGTIEWHQNQPTLRVYDGPDRGQMDVGFDQASDWDAAMAASREATRLLAARRASSGHVPAAAAPGFTYESCYLREMRHFIDAVRGKAPYDMCTVEEELTTVAAFHAILKSSAEGCEVSATA